MKVHVLVVPYDSGHHRVRMGAGPERLIAAGVLDGLRDAKHDSTVSTFKSAQSFNSEIASALEIQQWVATRVSGARAAGEFPLILSGNCSTSVGTMAGLLARSRRTPGVCWFDAHADFNTPETTESGFFDGMALSMLTGHCWQHLAKRIPGFRPIPESQVLLFGTRNLDGGERKALEASEIQWLKSLGDAPAATATLAKLRDSFGEVYLHIDLDVLDVSEGHVNSYSSKGGLSRARLCELTREISRSFHVGAAALSAYDPSCDTDDRIPAIARAVVETIAADIS